MEDMLIHFRLVGEEARAFREFSRQELRKPNEQVRFIIRHELERHGLLHPNCSPLPSKPEVQR